MKFHRSYAVLEEQNRDLRQERDTLLTELGAAHKQILALQKQLGSNRRPSTKLQHRNVRNVAKLHKAVPPTSSSRPSRGWGDTPPFPSPSLTDYTQLVYHDGKLIDTEQRNAGYMKHTESSANKIVSSITALNAGVMYTTKLRESRLNLYLSENTESESEPQSSLPIPDIPCEEDQDQDNSSFTTISLLTHLDNPQDDHFFSNPTTGSSILQLPFSLQMSLLQSAYDLVRQGTWSYIRQHFPRDQLRHFPEYWLQIRFGHQELEDSGFTLNTSNPAKQRIVTAMFSIIPLRNIIAHPSYVRDLKELDERLKSAQRLLVLLEDEERALKVRKLRDRVQEEAREILGEIERREGLKMLPGDEQPWPMHIQMMFEHVLLDRHREAVAPEAIVRAAREWRRMGYKVGEDEEGFQVRLEEARERMRSMHDGSETSSESGSASCAESSWSDSTFATEVDKLANSDAGDGWCDGKAVLLRAPESCGW